MGKTPAGAAANNGTPEVPDDAPVRTDSDAPPSYEHEKGAPISEEAGGEDDE